MAYNDPNNPLVNSKNQHKNRWIRYAQEIHTNWGFDITTRDDPMSLLKAPEKRDVPIPVNVAAKLSSLSGLTQGRGVAVISRLLELSIGDYMSLKGLEQLTRDMKTTDPQTFAMGNYPVQQPATITAIPTLPAIDPRFQQGVVQQVAPLIQRGTVQRVADEAGQNESIYMTDNLQDLGSLSFGNHNDLDDNEDDTNWHAQSNQFNPRLRRMYVEELKRFVRINALQSGVPENEAETLAVMFAKQSDGGLQRIQHDLSQMGQGTSRQGLAVRSARNKTPEQVHAGSPTGVTQSSKSVVQEEEFHASPEMRQSPHTSPRNFMERRSEGSLSRPPSPLRHTPNQGNENTVSLSPPTGAVAKHTSVVSFEEEAYSDTTYDEVLELYQPEVVHVEGPQALNKLEATFSLAARHKNL